MKVIIGADHAGFELKESLKPLLTELGHVVTDVGTDSTDAVDYPDIATAVVAEMFEQHEDVETWTDLRGICLLYTSPSPRDRTRSRMPSSA